MDRRRMGLLAVIALVAVLAAAPTLTYAEDDVQVVDTPMGQVTVVNGVGATDPSLLPLAVQKYQEAQEKANAQAAAMRQEITDRWTREGTAGLLDGQVVGHPDAVRQYQEREALTYYDAQGVGHQFGGSDGKPTTIDGFEADSVKMNEQIRAFNKMRKQRSEQEGDETGIKAAEEAEAQTEAMIQRKTEERRKFYETLRPKTLRSGD